MNTDMCTYTHIHIHIHIQIHLHIHVRVRACLCLFVVWCGVMSCDARRWVVGWVLCGVVWCVVVVVSLSLVLRASYD